MSMFNLFSILISIAAFFSFINFRYIRLPNAIRDPQCSSLCLDRLGDPRNPVQRSESPGWALCDSRHADRPVRRRLVSFDAAQRKLLLLTEFTYVVVVFSILVQGLTLKPLAARWQ